MTQTLNFPIVGPLQHVVEQSPLLANWLASVDPGTTIQKIEIQSVDTINRPTGITPFIIKLRVTAQDKDGNTIPGIVILRGNAVAILPILITPTQRYALLVTQQRLPSGGLLTEAPAGMCDNVANARAVAVRELAEETGLVTQEEALIALGTYLLSPGILDERIHLFAFEQTMSENEAQSFIERQTGLAEEGEFIRLAVVPLDEISTTCQDLKTQTLALLYRQHMQPK